jgi:hypothetical protein
VRPCLLIALLPLAAAQANADGGAIVLQGESGPWRITLFAPSLPLYAGQVNLTALVQDGRTGTPVIDAQVAIRVGRGSTSATHDLAANRVLYAANLKLPAGAAQRIAVKVRGNGTQATIETQESVSEGTESPWGYVFCISLVPVTILLFFANLYLRGRVVKLRPQAGERTFTRAG